MITNPLCFQLLTRCADFWFYSDAFETLASDAPPKSTGFVLESLRHVDLAMCLEEVRGVLLGRRRAQEDDQNRSLSFLPIYRTGSGCPLVLNMWSRVIV
jgi:hypothetical protein